MMGSADGRQRSGGVFDPRGDSRFEFEKRRYGSLTDCQ